MRVLAYIRVSTDKQGEKYGPEVQLADIRRWAAAEGHELVESDDWVDHMSGGTDAEVRPGLMSCIHSLKTKGATGIIAGKRDRFARGVVQVALLTRLAEREGARLYAADGVGNGEEGADIMMRAMVDAFAEYERWLIKSRTTAGRRRKATHHGGWTGGVAPLGYTQVGGKLVVDGREADIVRLIFWLQGRAFTVAQIVSQLTSSGFLTRSGAPWTHMHVKRVLERRSFYESRTTLITRAGGQVATPEHEAILGVEVPHDQEAPDVDGARRSDVRDPVRGGGGGQVNEGRGGPGESEDGGTVDTGGDDGSHRGPDVPGMAGGLPEVFAEPGGDFGHAVLGDDWGQADGADDSGEHGAGDCFWEN